MGSLGVSKVKKRIDPTSMPIVDPIIGMNLSSSQMELVQSWVLGHSGPFSLLLFHDMVQLAGGIRKF
jgi:hypothetical protein